MASFVVAVVLLVIIGGALLYIIREKKRGVKCIGCPDGATCSHNCAGCGSSCAGHQK